MRGHGPNFLTPLSPTGAPLACVHQAAFRNGFAQQKTYRCAPSELRDKLCAEAWAMVCEQGEEHRREVAQRMTDACDARDAEI